MIIRHFSVFVLVCFFCLISYSQSGKGKIAGKIIDKSNGEDLIGAVVQIEGTNSGAATDIEGKYVINLDPGIYTVILTYISYKTEKIQGVEVKAGQVTYLNFAMKEDVQEMDEVVITYTAEKSSTEALLIERKNTTQVSDGVSADQIRKTPDRSTADVLKRVTGASIQEGKFAIIRGMNDRYNAGYLDGAPLPSTETDRKAFAFDVIPAALIDKVVILKAGTPDLMGDFGGGIIQISTKSVPEKFTQQISVGGQFHSLTTFKDFKEFGGSSRLDRFGYSANGIDRTINFRSVKFRLDDNPRALPETTGDFVAERASNRPNLVENTLRFNDNFRTETFKAPINSRFSYSLGAPIKIGRTTLGVLFAYSYSNTRRFSEGFIDFYRYEDNFFRTELRDMRYYRNVSSGGILNLNWKLTPNHIIGFKSLYNVNTDDNTITRSGSVNKEFELSGRSSATIFNMNQLFTRQINGDHAFLQGKLRFDYIGSISVIDRDMPDFKIASYEGTGAIQSLVTGSNFSNSSGRFFSKLDETIRSVGSNLTFTQKIINSTQKLKVGYFFQERKRSFESRIFTYFNPPSSTKPSSTPDVDLTKDKISTTTLMMAERTARDNNFYDAKSFTTAFYGMAETGLFKDRLRLIYGARFEYFGQVLSNFGVTTAEQDFERVILPSASMVASVSEKSNLRAAVYKTVNRPEFRELAPFVFFNFDLNSTLQGNTALKTADILNYEMRFEHYPSANQIVSFGIFYKNIQNPIELNIDVGQPTQRVFFFANEKSATNIGAEFELRKSLEFLNRGSKFFQSTSFYTNLTLVSSKINVDENSNSTRNRTLQGQSPYVLNFGIQYENEETGWGGSFVANRIGRRIFLVGAPGGQTYGLDLYENPRTVLDAQLSKNIGKLNIRFTLGDLLRQDLVFYQDINNNGRYDKSGDNTVFRFTYGFTSSLSLTYKF